MIYVRAFNEDNMPILGTVDGQTVFKNKNYKRTKHYKALQAGQTENNSVLSLRAKYWKIVDENDGLLETIDNPFFRG